MKTGMGPTGAFASPSIADTSVGAGLPADSSGDEFEVDLSMIDPLDGRAGVEVHIDWAEQAPAAETKDLTHLQLLAAGKAIKLLPQATSIVVDGKRVQDPKLALAAYQANVNPHQRSALAKWVDQRITNLLPKPKASLEQQAIDGEVLAMRPKVAQWATWLAQKASAVNTWIRSTRVGQWLESYKRHDPTRVQGSVNVQVGFASGVTVRFQDKVEDAQSTLILQRIAAVTTATALLPAPPGVGLMINGLVAGSYLLSAAAVGIKMGLAHLGVGKLENAGGWPLASAMLCLSAEQVPLAIPFAPPVLPPVLIEAHATNVARLTQKTGIPPPLTPPAPEPTPEELGLSVKPWLYRTFIRLTNRHTAD